ncbi:hypothetical protein V6C27_05440 [Peptococcaceae bacterium 1198_IL3148]
MFADKRGMTLLETVVTMTVIIVVLVPLTNLYLQTKHLSKASLSETQGLYRAQSILEEQKAVDFNAVTATNWIEVEDGRYRILVTANDDVLKVVTINFQYPPAVYNEEIFLTMYKANR